MQCLAQVSYGMNSSLRVPRLRGALPLCLSIVTKKNMNYFDDRRNGNDYRSYNNNYCLPEVKSVNMVLRLRKVVSSS